MFFTGDITKVRGLIEGGASVNTKDNNGWTPLHEVCSKGYLDIACLLVEAGAEQDIPAGPDYVTPLHDAVRYDRKDIVVLLLASGHSVDVADNMKRKPSHPHYTGDADLVQVCAFYLSAPF